MNRLRAYVRRTMTERAREYAYPAKRRTPDSTRSMCMDATRGTDTGWWDDLIYTADILDRFNANRAEVRAAIREFIGETGADVGERYSRDGKTTWADLIAATGDRYTWADYTSNDARAVEAEHACCALRFAVEYLAGEVARDLCPDL